MSLESVVNQSVFQLLPNSPPLPFIFRGLFSGFHWLHSTWHWYRQGKIYLNPDNFLKLTTGHALNFAVGDNRYVRLAAQCVMISNCVLVSVREQTALNNSYRKFVDAIFDRHPPIVVHQWRKQPLSSFISPSTSYRIYHMLFQMENYFRNVAFRAAMFAKHFFKLSASLIDAVGAFAINAENGSRAVTELAINANDCLDAIAGNRDELIGKLNENKGVINCILTTIRAPCKAEQFIAYVDKTVSKVQTVSQGLSNVNKAVGTVVTESLKNLFFLLMSSVGASSAVPDRFVPAYGLLGNDPGKDDSGPRFAPVCRLNVNKHKPTTSFFPKFNYVNKAPNNLAEAYDRAASAA